MVAKHINTFAQGIDKDSSKNKYDNTHYYHAENFRMLTQDEMSSGALENIKGSRLRVNFTEGANSADIISMYTLYNTVIIWTNQFAAEGIDYIWSIPINDLKDAEENDTIITITSTEDYVHNGGYLVYKADMGLSTTDPIYAVGRIENALLKKIYWVDGVNRLRHLNIVHNSETNDLENLTVDQLEVIGNIDFSIPEITNIVSGNLKAGKVQYTYQLYKIGGAETVFASPSGLVPLTNSSDSASTSENYRGSDIDDSTGKSVRGEITINQAGYERIRIVALHYSDYNLDPEIRIIEEKEIDGTEGEVIQFTDTGSTIGNLILEDIRTIGTTLFIPKLLEIKDNILFAGNITEETWNVDFDARAYRFRGASADDEAYNYNPNDRRICTLRQENETGPYYQIRGYNTNKPVYYSSDGISSPTYLYSSWDQLPLTADCINPYNNLDNDGLPKDQYTFQSDGATLGGEGPNVKYEFRVKTVKLDNFTVGAEEKILTSQGSGDNFSYTNYASPYNAAEYIGYHRDETYRYAIVFFDDKGRSSFTKWIGDIRMPSISTLSESIKYSTTGGSTTYQNGTITIMDDTERLYVISFGDETYYVDNDFNPESPDQKTAAEIALEFYNDIETNSSIGTVSNYTSELASFTITFNVEGVVSVNTTPGIFYNQLDDYNPGGTSYSDFNTVYIDNGGDGDDALYMNILYPYFTINNIPEEVVNYQIVRVQRTSLDRTVISQGLVMGTEGTGLDRHHISFPDSTGWDDTTYTFQSPEIAIFKELTIQSNDKLQNVAQLADPRSATYGNPSVNFPKTTSPALLDVYKYGPMIALTDEFNANHQTDIEEGRIVRQDETDVVIKDVNYTVEDTTDNTVKGISAVLNVSNTSFSCRNKGITQRYLTNYRRNTFATQYGGITYTARRRNTYIGASKIQKANEGASISCFGGDTYINIFDYLYRSYNDGATVLSDGPTQVVYFPVESSINLDLRGDLSTRHVYSQPGSELIHDSAGIWTDDSSEPVEFVQGDLYIYNTAYSKENDAKIYISKPFDFQEQKTFSVRTRSSQAKIQNELSDSWLRFGVNAYKDVDPQYGELTALINVSEKLMYFQPKAFGVLSVNERALLQTQEISQLSLGTSGVLDRFDYAKTGIGTVNRDHIRLTANGLYWLDEINMAMMKFASGVEEVSMMKGLDGWFRNNIVAGNDMLMWYNPEYREVCLTDATNSWTIVYSEVTDGFVTYLTTYPKKFVNYENRVLTISDDPQSLYLHDDLHSNRGMFQSGVNDSTITLVINPLEHDIATFNNMEWLMEALDMFDEDVAETFTEIEIWNDYQHSGVISLTPSINVKRRGRKWRYTVPRARYKRDGLTSLNRRDARFRDGHIFVKLYLSNLNNTKFIMHDIITSFMQSNK